MPKSSYTDFNKLLEIITEADIFSKIDKKGYVDKVHVPFSNLFNAYSKAINKSYNRTGSLFQEHLKRNKIKDETFRSKRKIYPDLGNICDQLGNQPYHGAGSCFAFGNRKAAFYR